jgi:hypothetical protein
MAAMLVVLTIALLASVLPCCAQAAPPPPVDFFLGTGNPNGNALPLLGGDAEGRPRDPLAPTADAATPSLVDDEWHISVTPYLWFPGMFGTVGATGRELRVDATPGDLLSHFRFGLMGLVDLRRNRLVLPLDMFWVRLGDDKPLPLETRVTTANMKAQEFILTPKVGLRLLGTEKIKIDALTGFRYWHLGASLNFNPAFLGLNFSRSQNWVDPVVGGRIQGALSSKFLVTVGGDVGGWGTGSQLDYQVAGALGYRIKTAWTLQAGYRYLAVNYRSGGFLYNVFSPGALFGVTIDLK